MAKHTQVPKFGNWESEEIPYTICFDNATKGKKSGQIHQSDPQENLEVESKGHKISESISPKHERNSSREEMELRKYTVSPLHSFSLGLKTENDHSSPKWHNHGQYGSYTSETDMSRSPDVNRRRHYRRVSREEFDNRRLTDSPLRQEAAGWKSSSDSPQHRHGGMCTGDTPRRVARQSVGSDRSVEHSPLHLHTQARVGGKCSAISSPSWERKATSEGSHGLAPSTPGRSRLRSVTRGEETPDHGPAVPKFGDWDETDPAAAEGYTHIFNRVREEKQSETGKVPVLPTETSQINGHKQLDNDDAKGCGCFPWVKR